MLKYTNTTQKIKKCIVDKTKIILRVELNIINNIKFQYNVLPIIKHLMKRIFFFFYSELIFFIENRTSFK